MDNTSIEKLKKLLIANTVCLLLIVSVLVMSPLVSSARASGSGYNLGTPATFVDILKDIRGNILHPPDTNASDLQNGDTLDVTISTKMAIGVYQGNSLIKVNNTILNLTFQNTLILKMTFENSSQSTNQNNDQSTSQSQYSLATGSSYTGVIHNAAVDQTSDMTLSFTSVTQSAITGNFTLTNGPLTGSGPFTGSMNNQRSILFTSTATDGSNDTITFVGSIDPDDGSISGSYSGVSPTVPVETGIWYVVPKASYPTNACNTE